MSHTDSVRECEPQRHENHPGKEVHASQKGTSEKKESDSGKDKLEINQSGHWECRAKTSTWDVCLTF
jgi:hypothetical protein